jgi:hypothetical protein
MSEYIPIHDSYLPEFVEGAMTWFKGVFTAIYHIMEKHDIVHPALNILVLPCPGV